MCPGCAVTVVALCLCVSLQQALDGESARSQEAEAQVALLSQQVEDANTTIQRQQEIMSQVRQPQWRELLASVSAQRFTAGASTKASARAQSLMQSVIIISQSLSRVW